MWMWYIVINRKNDVCRVWVLERLVDRRCDILK